MGLNAQNVIGNKIENIIGIRPLLCKIWSWTCKEEVELIHNNSLGYVSNNEDDQLTAHKWQIEKANSFHVPAIKFIGKRQLVLKNPN